jgi:hypothetical protein
MLNEKNEINLTNTITVQFVKKTDKTTKVKELTKNFLTFFLLLFFTSGFSQNFFTDSPQKTTEFFYKNKNISLKEIQQLLYHEVKTLRRTYNNRTKFRSPYIEKLDKTNTDPERYISHSKLPEIHRPQKLLNLYHEKKKDLDYHMYHTTEYSKLVLNNLPSYGGFVYQKNLNFQFLSAYLNGKESHKDEFKFYTQVDSAKVLYSYRYPKTIDTIRVQVGKPKSSNIYGITLEPYMDYGIVAKVPYNINYKILDVAGVDKNGKTLLANVLSNYNNYNITDKSLLKQVGHKLQILITLHDQIISHEIKSVDAFKTALIKLKKDYDFKTISKSPIISQNFLFQLFGYAQEVVIYIQTEEGFISEKLNITSQKKQHPIYDSYDDRSKNYDEPNEYFYNKKKKRKLPEKAYFNIEFLGGGMFKVKNKEKKCERLLVTKKGKLKKFDDCYGNLKRLENDGFLIEYTSNYGMNQDSVFIYDREGKLRLEVVNGTPMNEIFYNSHFIVSSSNKQDRFILGNYKQTEILDSYQIFSPHKALIFKGEKCGIIDDFGKKLVPLKYTKCQMIGQHHFIAYLNSQQVIVSDKNKIVHKETLHYLEPIRRIKENEDLSIPYLNLVIFEEKNLFGLKNIKGETIYPPTAKGISEVGPNRIAIQLKNDMLGVIDEKGNVVIPFEYEEINPYYKGFAILINDKGKKFTFFELNGEVKTIHKAKETYEIWNVFGRPTLVLDDKIHIRYNGYIIEEAE